MKIERSQERIDQTGEVFTPPVLIKEMLDRFPSSVWKKEKTFLDNSCGDGNFLVGVVSYKVEEHGHSALEALSTTYGVDLMFDNVKHARQRLVKLAKGLDPNINENECKKIVKRNIVCHDALTYHYKFNGTHDCVRQSVCEDCKRAKERARAAKYRKAKRTREQAIAFLES